MCDHLWLPGIGRAGGEIYRHPATFQYYWYVTANPFP